jgi:toxin ParE1/3/4
VGEFRLSRVANAQVVDILARSEDMWGEQARERYAALLAAAMSDIADDPRNPLIHWKHVRGITLGLYHIEHSRRNVSDPPEPVGDPRHLIVFRISGDKLVDILGVMHERMLARRVLREILRRNTDNDA